MLQMLIFGSLLRPIKFYELVAMHKIRQEEKKSAASKATLASEAKTNTCGSLDKLDVSDTQNVRPALLKYSQIISFRELEL